jgi:hypothetical protein
MKPVDPRVDPSLVPPGSKAVVIAENQDEWLNLPSVRTPPVYDGEVLMINPYVITRWSLTDEERWAVMHGADVFITLVSAGPINPLFASVGPCDWKEPVK